MVLDQGQAGEAITAIPTATIRPSHLPYSRKGTVEQSTAEWDALVTLLLPAQRHAEAYAAAIGEDYNSPAYDQAKNAADALRLAEERFKWTVREEAEKRAREKT